MTETEQSLGVVYVVDDDEAVRDSLQWLLEGVNYSVQAYDSAEAFLAAFDPQALACLILDVRMPGMSGLQLQEELAQRKAELPIVFITGHGDVPMATAREQQVLERIVAGRLNKQIADDLGISIKTVEAHRANIMDKLNANTVADLMRIALAVG